MNILFTICGRAGSKGIKNKNISSFLGYPLVYYTLSAVELFMKRNIKNYTRIDLAVNTDSEALIELIKHTQMSCIYIPREEDLATDTSSKIDVIRDTLDKAEQMEEVTYDYVIDLDITSPLRTVQNIEELINKIKMNDNLDLVFSVTHSRRNPYFNMVMRSEGKIKKVINSNFTARQQAPEIYDMNASMYVYRNNFLLNTTNKGLFDGQIDIIEMKDTAILDIDHEEDLELMQVIAQYFYEQYPAYACIREHIENYNIRKEG